MFRERKLITDTRMKQTAMRSQGREEQDSQSFFFAIREKNYSFDIAG